MRWHRAVTRHPEQINKGMATKSTMYLIIMSDIR